MEMLEAARGWLTPAVLFVLVNLVIATIAVASRLVSPGGVDEAGGGRRALLRAPSLAVDRLRASFSFSRLFADHAPLFYYAAAEPSPEPPATVSAAAATAAGNGGHDDEVEREEVVRIERSRSEAAAELAPSSRRPRARRTRMAAAEEPAPAHDVVVTPARAHRAAAVAVAREVVAGRGEEPAVEVDARADDFIRRFREQLRLQRLDSILRYRDTLRRTGTA